MALRLDQDPTTGVEWEWREAGVPSFEADYGARAPGSSLTRTFVLRHDWLASVRIVGFQLSPVQAIRDHRPTQTNWDRTPARDVEDMLRWADEFGGGLYAIQGAVTTQFRSGVGSSAANLLPCTLGAAGDGTVAPGEEISLGLRLDVPAGIPKAVSMDLEVLISYRKVL